MFSFDELPVVITEGVTCSGKKPGLDIGGYVTPSGRQQGVHLGHRHVGKFLFYFTPMLTGTDTKRIIFLIDLPRY